MFIYSFYSPTTNSSFFSGVVAFLLETLLFLSSLFWDSPLFPLFILTRSVSDFFCSDDGGYLKINISSMVSLFCGKIFKNVNTQETPCILHYENFPMQYTEIFLALKIENFQLKIFDIFLIYAQNIDCGYTLEPPPRGGSNEYPQSMFWSKNKKNRYTPAYPSFTI